MKKSVLLILFVAFVISCNKTTPNVQENDFKDKKLQSFLLEKFDDNKDGKLSDEEFLKIKKLNISSLEIKTIEGINKLQNLEILDISDNQIDNIDISSNTKLLELNVSNNINLKSIDITSNKLLKILKYSPNQQKQLLIKNGKGVGVLSGYDTNYYYIYLVSTTQLKGDWNMAVQFCNSLGEDWVLPSEWEPMYNTKKVVNEALKFNKKDLLVDARDTYYWTSDELIRNNVLAFPLEDGLYGEELGLPFDKKWKENYIRCVCNRK